MNDFNFLNLFGILILTLVVNPVFAEEGSSAKPAQEKQEHSEHSKKGMDHSKHDHSDQNATAQKVGKEKLLIKVKGMVCAFCAQGIRKNFNAREEVAETNVDLDKMEVSITFKKGKSLPEAAIKELVTDAGFSFAGVVHE